MVLIRFEKFFEGVLLGVLGGFLKVSAGVLASDGVFVMVFRESFRRF